MPCELCRGYHLSVRLRMAQLLVCSKAYFAMASGRAAWAPFCKSWKTRGRRSQLWSSHSPRAAHRTSLICRALRSLQFNATSNFARVQNSIFPAVYTHMALTALLVVHSSLYRVAKTQLNETKWQLHGIVIINQRSHRRTWILSGVRYCTQIRGCQLPVYVQPERTKVTTISGARRACAAASIHSRRGRVTMSPAPKGRGPVLPSAETLRVTRSQSEGARRCKKPRIR
jgi:hypothetical protein